MFNSQKVLFLIPNLRCGGSERVLTNLLKFLDKSKFEIYLAILDSRDAIFLAEIPDHITIIDLNCRRVRHSPRKIFKLVRQIKPDTIFSTLSHLNILLSILKALFSSRIKIVARESAIVSKLVEDSKLKWAWHFLYRVFYNRIDLIICQSKYMQNDLISNFGIRPEKTTVIYNPLDLKKITEMARLEKEVYKNVQTNCPINIVASGRLSEEKGFEMLIEGLSLTKRTDISLSILGSGVLSEKLQQLIYDNKLENQVFLLGHKSNPYPYYQQANAFILSSKHEGLPNVVLEALACGTPVLSTPATGGLAEILTGVESCEILGSISSIELKEGLNKFNYSSRVPSDVTLKYDVKNITKLYELELINHASL